MELTCFVHSSSVDNEAGIRSGWYDAPLSERGRAQARSLRDHCDSASFEAIYCSDLGRAVETAGYAFPGCTPELDARLREMNYGLLNGRPGREFPGNELECIETRFRGGENCLDVEARVRHFLERRLESSDGGRIAVISHRFPQLALEVICRGKTWEEAILGDWRRAGGWQPGWHYVYKPQ